MTTSHQKEQEERRQVLRDTMHTRGANDLVLENIGRFAKGSVIVGTEQTPAYPKLPANSPWADDVQVPDEAPLGFEIDAMEPLGTEAEIEASLGDAAVPPSPTAAVASSGEESAAPPGSDFPLGIEEPSSPLPTTKLRRRV